MEDRVGVITPTDKTGEMLIATRVSALAARGSRFGTESRA